MLPLNRPAFIVDGADRLLCPIPLKINTYRGCQGKCLYCSMSGQHARWKSRAKGDITEVAPSPIKYIEHIFYKSHGMERQLIEERYPVQIGHASDPLQPLERQHQITLKTLGILADFEYPTILTTKFPGMLTTDPYLRAIDGLPLAVQCSISSEDQAMLGILEPAAPSWKRRLAAMSTLTDSGVTCILRLWPYIPDLAGNLEVLLGAAHDAGVRMVQANFLRLYNASNGAKTFNRAVGYDYSCCSVLDYQQRKNAKTPSIPAQIRESILLQSVCDDLGLDLLTADDFSGNRNWRCCCGTSDIPGFKPAPWAYQVNGHRIGDHTTYEDYMKGYDCPYGADFRLKWDSGDLAKIFDYLIFNSEDKTYSRLA